MRILNKQLRPALAAILAGLMAGVAPAGLLRAAEHVVPSEALTQRLEADSARRAADEKALQELFASESSRRVLSAAGMDAEQVTAGVATLEDADLSRLAERARSYQADVAAGALNNQQITYILIALGTAVIILVIVAAD
jgi:hypothetical protein